MVDPLKIFWLLTNSTYLVTKLMRDGDTVQQQDPYFSQPLLEAEVPEDAAHLTHVISVAAEGPPPGSDLPKVPGVRYEILDGNIGDVFGIDAISGDVTVIGTLDYENRSWYELNLGAVGGGRVDGEGEELLLAEATLLVRVLDANDMAPVFEKPVYRAQLTEEDSEGLPKRIVTVKAVDGDADRPHNVVYFITGPGIDPDDPKAGNFLINATTGDIFVLKPLDRDPPHGKAQWRFTAFAQDEGGEGLVGYTDVQLSLKDVNDNAPAFPLQLYWGSVTENSTAGLEVANVTAVDHDDAEEGNNANIVYMIEKNALEEDSGKAIFEIDQSTGLIRTALCCLDREKTSDYSIEVVAIDGGGLKGTGTVSILVKDINDMPPEFTKSNWITEVDETDGETIPEKPILTVTVHDQDEFNNFQYKVVEESGYGADKFSLAKNADGTASLKIIKPLDYEDENYKSYIKFKIQVTDQTDDNDTAHHHVAYSWVTIRLRDINDNVPEFSHKFLELNVPENIEIGKSLHSFVASDKDNDGHSKIMYSISKKSDIRRNFQIDQQGTVFIQRSLDRELTPFHKVLVLAIDDGSPPKTATATLKIIVEDINDNAPRLTDTIRPVLPEHTPPTKFFEVFATDDDSENNGPPFTFKMDPKAKDEIRASFKIENNYRGANGNGSAIISSLRPFDREKQKEYLIPITIKDSGYPEIIGTSTLTVIIGDENDNKMNPGSKQIFVYNYKGQERETEIGRVFVEDLDDWDLDDKMFSWDGRKHSKFKLDERTGIIKMEPSVKEGRYQLYFKVQDYRHSQSNVRANVTVTVREITYDAVVNSGSFRLSGIGEQDVIKSNCTQGDCGRNMVNLLRNKLSEVFRASKENVNIFSVQSDKVHKRATNLRFSICESYCFKAERLNGILQMKKGQIESAVGINITTIGIDNCLDEGRDCVGTCVTMSSQIVVGSSYLVDGNKTAFVGVSVLPVHRSCRSTDKGSTHECHCLNGGRCVRKYNSYSCACPKNYLGPRCQRTVRSFNGNGWAWFEPLATQENSHLSLEFATFQPNGVLLYNGPLAPPETNQMALSDFISLELKSGVPLLLVDFGSGTKSLKIGNSYRLDDGKFHRIDIIWNTEVVRLVIDLCKSAEVIEMEDGTPAQFHDSSCQVEREMPLFSEYLNVNTPLQLGGVHHLPFEASNYNWKYIPTNTSFSGCIQNLFYNGQVYDLEHPAFSAGSEVGCRQTEQLCAGLDCGINGVCEASFHDAHCDCKAGWTSTGCLTPTVPSTFKSHSYVRFTLSFEPDHFVTRLQLRFRTRENHGELFHLMDQHNREYAILEINKGVLRFRYNLNSLSISENEVELSYIPIDDGLWHTVKVSRYGSVAILEVDGGEGDCYNETFRFEGHQWLNVDKQDGIYAGGNADLFGTKTSHVFADYGNGCIDDIRLDGKNLPLPPAMNGTQWGQATVAQNLERNCISNVSCNYISCPEPLECVDLWNQHECSCGDGWVLVPDRKICSNRNVCLDSPCINGGTCINQGINSDFHCLCPKGFWGETCENIQERWTLKLSVGAVAVIIVSLAVIVGLGILLLFCKRRQPKDEKVKPPPPPTKEDIRENIISYNDEGGGEDDMTAFDIAPLKIPVVETKAAEVSIKLSVVSLVAPRPKRERVEMWKHHVDSDPNCPPFDDLRNYAYEGDSSPASSLSHLDSSSEEEEDQDFDILTEWGPPLTKLCQIFNITPPKLKTSAATMTMSMEQQL